MEELIKLAQQVDIANLMVMGAMFWFGYSRLGGRMDKMQETLTDVDRRLCRLEGSFQAKECCLLKSDSQHKAAE